jgi:hypothetical protein
MSTETRLETKARVLADQIARSKTFLTPLRVRPELYYSDAGNPGCAIDATGILSAYVEVRPTGVLEITVKDRGSGTEIGATFGGAAEAVAFAVEELVYRGAYTAAVG